MKKQTAVEWLQERLLLSLSDELKCLNGFFVIAKEMEKEQIKDAHLIGLITSMEMEATKQSEQYYNETFKNEEK
tara:strand:- start:465 stop:686 length:222 start_codon:yes stop_codon:yes gene_type:complete